MFKQKYCFYWLFSACVYLMVANTALAADIFKSSEFLKWKRSAQEYYIRTSIGMAGFIAHENDTAHAKCIEKWYLSDQKKSTDFILETMAKYPKYHPRGIIIAILAKKCGSFKYSKR